MKKKLLLPYEMDHSTYEPVNWEGITLVAIIIILVGLIYFLGHTTQTCLSLVN